MSDTELVSVITPTFGRPDMLPAAYGLFRDQTYPALEWIVIDDSPERCAFFDELDDPRVKYIHLGERQSTGSKRNLGISHSKGSIIVQFDDDDYYHPQYVSAMVRSLHQGNADLVKLVSFFVLHKATGSLGFWDLRIKEGNHFSFSPLENVSAGHGLTDEEREDIHLGYGFSYVFKRSVWEASRFDDKFWNQDTPFVKKAIENGFKVAFLEDQIGLCLHIIHDRNVSKSFPQYLFPQFMLKRYFPKIQDYLSLCPQVDGTTAG